ncbi:MAG: fibronectin type III domain-containing protein [Bacteriovoracaceae bacterium]|nr:fibronectin type III domain-containing protein [Bacteriovoracaceae bacterium]
MFHQINLMLLICLLITSCNEVHIKAKGTKGSAESSSLIIKKATDEIIGSCTFTATPSVVADPGFSFRVTFPEAIDPASLATLDIMNQGTGGSISNTWDITSCGDNINFMLTASSIEGYGTIIPKIQESTLADSVLYMFFGWKQEAYIKASNNDTWDNLGYSVSINGDTLAVGSTWESSDQTTITNGPDASLDNSNGASGAVYIYKRTGMSWEQEAYIKASNNNSNDFFGYSTSINGDTLAIGAIWEDSNQTIITNGTTASADNTNSNSGAVYIYNRTGLNWQQEAYIKANNNDTDDNFGNSVSISAHTLAVGVTMEDSNDITITNGTSASIDNTSSNSGAVYIYKRTGSNWAQEAYIKASNNDSSDYFGYSVSLDGDHLAVGVVSEDSNATTITNGTGASADNSNANSGAVYIYKRTGSNWAQEAYIKASNNDPGDYFGYSVSISGDTLAVAAIYERSNQTTITNGIGASADNSNISSGAVYIYKRTGSNWAQEAYIKASNNGPGDNFGYSVSISGDTLAVASIYESSNQTTITNDTTASANNSNMDSGAVYIYKRTGSNWVQESYIKASNNDPSDNFGYSVSINGDTLAVSAMYEDSNQMTITDGTIASPDNSNDDSGAVYIYRNYSRLFEVTDIWSSSDSSSVTLSWNKSGGNATGYIVTYALGTSAPSNCSSGITTNVGNVDNYEITPLSAATTYSFRVCATDGVDITSGSAISVNTAP